MLTAATQMNAMSTEISIVNVKSSNISSSLATKPKAKPNPAHLGDDVTSHPVQDVHLGQFPVGFVKNRHDDAALAARVFAAAVAPLNHL